MKRVAIVLGALALVLAGAVVARVLIERNHDEVVVVHWANSHPMRDALLPAMADEFNRQHHETANGDEIRVVVVKCDSAFQMADLSSRITGGATPDDACEQDGAAAPDPTIVTPQSRDWLVGLNRDAGRDVVDLAATEDIADTWLGIVTYRDMAECLGWPQRQIGYADIIALSQDPDGWQSRDCAKPSWGPDPLLAFTNPLTSTSGRNMLVSLYSIAAQKEPADLTVADVQAPEVQQYVQDFQSLVEHYLRGTVPLNTKVRQGPRYGHFFVMPEDNLVSLEEGNEKALGRDGTEEELPPVDGLVMVYPTEGSVLNDNPAAVVDATWVTPDQAEGAQEWIDYLRADDQQRDFMAAGFRPARGVDLEVDATQFASWNLNPEPPTTQFQLGDVAPDVLADIVGSWDDIKNPAIVTFVVDVSGSMRGDKLDQVKAGLANLLDGMTPTARGDEPNQVGLVTFSDTIEDEVLPAPLADAGSDIVSTVYGMQAGGGTALFDAVKRAIELTDRAEGSDGAVRAVVVLSDGAATSGACLDELIRMTTVGEGEQTVDRFCGQDRTGPPIAGGQRVTVDDIQGSELVSPHDHDVQVFFVGFGESDVQVGRLLAEATGAEYQGTTDTELASVIEGISGYF